MTDRDTVSAEELGEDFKPNRKQRRDYVRLNQTRQGRKNIVGFGAWRRHHENVEDRHHGLVDAPVPEDVLIDRREIRPQRIAQAKARRRLLRQQSRGRIT